MDIVYLLVPLSLVLVFAIGAVFWWALHHGQFEDLEGPAHRILMDEDTPRSTCPAERAPAGPRVDSSANRERAPRPVA